MKAQVFKFMKVKTFELKLTKSIKFWSVGSKKLRKIRVEQILLHDIDQQEYWETTTLRSC